MHKVSLILLVLTFVALLITIVGMSTPYELLFIKIHQVVGSLFIVLIFAHLYFNRIPLKMMLKHKAIAGEENGKNIDNHPSL